MLHFSCKFIDALAKGAPYFVAKRPQKRPAATGKDARMALEKLPKSDESATSSGAQQPVADQKQTAQSEVEESSPKKTTNTAQKQRQAQPEVESKAQPLNETQAPAEESAPEAVVRGRRKSPEFNLIASEDVMVVVGARPAPYIAAVIAAAKRRVHYAEAVLSGSVELVTIARVEMDFDTWWAPFKVDDLWFVLKYSDAYIRKYKLELAVGPAPGNGGPPPRMTRRQLGAPPEHIGPRPRARREREEPEGARTAKGAPPKKAKKKASRSERILNNLYNKLRWQFFSQSNDVAHALFQRWLEFKPRLLRKLVEMRRIERACGSALRVLHDDAAAFVQKQPVFALLAHRTNLLFTGARQRASHMLGPAGRLEPRCTGHNTGLNILIYSWIWDEPPVDWSQYLFGVDWSKNLFGEPPEEEQAFT